MCLITFAIDQHPDYSLILVANRDEFFARPTRAAQYWTAEESGSEQGIFAGRDQQAGGTWLGLNDDGRFAALTNFREVTKRAAPAATSRGALPLNFIRATDSPENYLQALANTADDYEGFNLIAGDACGVHYFSNRGDSAPTPLPAGTYALSNGLINSDWPKVNSAKQGLRRALEHRDSHALITALFGMMRNHDLAPPEQLPNTGVPKALELQLSSRFIEHPNMPHYGTRATTVLLFDRHGGVEFVERSFDEQGQVAGEVRQQWG